MLVTFFNGWQDICDWSLLILNKYFCIAVVVHALRYPKVHAPYMYVSHSSRYKISRRLRFKIFYSIRFKMSFSSHCLHYYKVYMNSMKCVFFLIFLKGQTMKVIRSIKIDGYTIAIYLYIKQNRVSYTIYN